MAEEKNTVSRGSRSCLRWVAVVCSLILVLGIVRAGVLLGEEPVQTQTDIVLSLDEGWTLTDASGEQTEVSAGAEVAVSGASAVLTRTLPAGWRSGTSLSFYSYGQAIRVLLNGEEIYSINCSPLAKTLLVSGLNCVELPLGEEDAELCLEIAAEEDGTVTVPSVSIESVHSQNRRVLQEEGFTVFIVVLLALMGCWILIEAVVTALGGQSDRKLLPLLLFIVDSILWALTDSQLYLFLGMQIELAAYVCYAAFLAMPVSVLWLTLYMTDHARPVRLLLYAAEINLALETLLSAFGILPLQNGVFVTHAIIFASIAVCLPLLRRRMKESREYWEKWYFYAFLLFGIFVLLSMLAYWLQGSRLYRIVLLLGMIAFYSLNLYMILRNFWETQGRQRQTEIRMELFRELSIKDTLTELPNRRAYEEELERLHAEAEKHPKAMLIMLDVNGLKNVNDSFGHASGDELLIKAAQCLRETFAEEGFVSRIGGDEFTVLLPEPRFRFPVYQSMLADRAAEIGASLRSALSFASGCSLLTDENGAVRSVESWEREADQEMYENKRRMHAVREN